METGFCRGVGVWSSYPMGADVVPVEFEAHTGGLGDGDIAVVVDDGLGYGSTGPGATILREGGELQALDVRPSVCYTANNRSETEQCHMCRWAGGCLLARSWGDGGPTMLDLRNSTVLRTICVLIAVCVISLPAQAKYSGGTGEPNAPYLISTAEDLVFLGSDPDSRNKHFELTRNIELPGTTGSTALIPEFSGTFDGNGFAISNLVIDATGSKRDYVGLFGVIGTTGVVKNLHIVNAYVAANAHVGGLAAVNNGRVDNCTADGFVSGDQRVGGLIGDNRGNILNSSSTGEVTVSSNDIDSNDVGGLAGANDYGATISHCYSTCEVDGLARKCRNFGGLVGWNQGIVLNAYSNGSVRGNNSGNESFGGSVGANEGSLLNCHSEGSVQGGRYVGGFIGSNKGRVTNCCSGGAEPHPLLSGNYVGGLIGQNSGHITNCYSTGSPSGSNRGGLVAYGASANVSNSVWDVNTSGVSSSTGGSGFTTEEMMEEGNYLAMRWDLAGRDEDGLHEVWQMPAEGGYPVLSVFHGYEPAQLAGQGTAENPYLIGDANELAAVLYHDPKANYRLTSDVDVSGVTWATSLIPEFTGFFDGNSCTVSNLTISGIHWVGLFGTVYPGAAVKGLGVEQIVVTGSNYVGGVAAKNEGRIEACRAAGRVEGNRYVGGLVGHSRNDIRGSYSSVSVDAGTYVGGLVGANTGKISRCHTDCNEVSGNREVGGLVGSNNRGNVTESYTCGKMVSGGSYVGGLVGDNDYGSVRNSYSHSRVEGSYRVGGFVGDNNSDGSIINCYSAGKVTGPGGARPSIYDPKHEEDIGGFAGNNKYVDDNWWPFPKVYRGLIAGCFWDVEASGTDWSAGGRGLPTGNMKDMDTYLDAGWDFYYAWKMGRRYPEVRWQELPYEAIDDVDDLIRLTVYPQRKYYLLETDIDLSGISLSPVAFFDGVLDGGGHTISNLHIDLPGSDDVGLFARLGRGAFVKNLTLKDVNVAGRRRVGGVAGYCSSGTLIDNCYVDGTVSAMEHHVGAIVGYNAGDVEDCNSSASVSGTSKVGGLLGANRGDLNRSKGSGTVTGDKNVGGLVGYNAENTYVRNCYYCSDDPDSIAGIDSAGGLVGHNEGIVKHCYATWCGDVQINMGGLIGSRGAKKGTCLASFWDIDASDQTDSAGGTGKHTDEMQTAITFLDAGWDFIDETENGTEDAWWIEESLDSEDGQDGQDYPRLRCEYEPPSPVGPKTATAEDLQAADLQ